MLESIIKTPDSSSPSDDESPVHNPTEDDSVDELPATPENDRIKVEFTTSGNCSKLDKFCIESNT